MQKALNIYLDSIRALLAEEEFRQAIDLLTQLNVVNNLDIQNDIVMQAGRLKRNEKDMDRGILDTNEYRRENAKIRYALLNLIDEIPRKLKLKGNINGVIGYDFGVSGNEVFEKIINSEDNLLKISWLEKALKATKSVCLVVTSNGGKGTGFLIANNYLITNNHVLQSATQAKTAYIEFNFEEDDNGANKPRYRYQLDANDFLTSDKYDLDFTRVKVLENPDAQPLSYWGALKINTSTIPEIGDPVTIIQHPGGEQKKIALNANEVIGIKNKHLFYRTDTEAGSSGSPVFNRAWEVIALHHASAAFRNKEANRGILFSHIIPKIDQLAANTINHTPNPKIEHTSSSDVKNIVQTESTQTDNRSNQSKPEVAKLFLLYDAQNDVEAAQTLKKHLSPMIYITKEIDVFDMHHDKRLGFGKKINELIKQQLLDATFVLALVSPSFFVSSYPLAEEARIANKDIIPILIKPSDFYEPSFLGDLRALPSNDQFVTDWANKDRAYTDIVQKIRLFLEWKRK